MLCGTDLVPSGTLSLCARSSTLRMSCRISMAYMSCNFDASLITTIRYECLFAC